MDRTARILYSHLAIVDGRPTDAFATSNLAEGLRYVASVVQQAFGAFDFSSEPQSAIRAARVWCHATGTVLLLKAVLGECLSGSPFVTILVGTLMNPLKIFISYRREDTGGDAGRLNDTLNQLLGSGTTFLDLEQIAPGKNFEVALDAAR